MRKLFPVMLLLAAVVSPRAAMADGDGITCPCGHWDAAVLMDAGTATRVANATFNGCVTKYYPTSNIQAIWLQDPARGLVLSTTKSAIPIPPEFIFDGNQINADAFTNIPDVPPLWCQTTLNDEATEQQGPLDYLSANRCYGIIEFIASLYGVTCQATN
jgi:hypothetical protein